MIDFRSDTVTRPTAEMRDAMASADVGDDVYGDDPTVNSLQAYAAERLGFESALFTATGTQANLLAIMGHCGRGDEYLCGQSAHNYRYEGGGAAVLGSVQPQPIENEPDGSINLDKAKAAIKADDIHFAPTRLLSLENTIGGKVLSLDYQRQARSFCDEHGLLLHLDGARVFNAAVKSDCDVTGITRHYDSVSVCLSKGLGAPVGSLLLGTKTFIDRTTHLRKMLGGGMRQAGILAAAGRIALEQGPLRLFEDHENAEYLSAGLARIPQLEINPASTQTNIVYARCRSGKAVQLRDYLADQGILITAGDPLRLVTHLDVNRQDVDRLLEAIRRFYQLL
ncbi:low-specificity L-threonine aldolase [Marinobacter orientalis]|uniref:Low-specificity L-threonine aldolase n=1 Tax=Marinobacter orientalis TaxID=1928859 RepID=A0A7Y0RDR7_9GAMM|nr:low-specificity L-threonine aldolase [Marinobacter orientalis]NMT64382.1 low-specificity L-threonine aldolase [Marinobacter orientalis]TGX50649.1 low-specificity L-threonine aldolase [Marinobacter orientalis]